MKAVEFNLPPEIDKSFIVFRETGDYFPAPWHYHSHCEFVLVTESSGRRMVGDHIGHFEAGDLVFIGSMLPHVWINDPAYLRGNTGKKADAVVIHFDENFLGGDFLQIPEIREFRKILKIAERGIELRGRTREKIESLMKEMPEMNGLQRLASLLRIFDLMSDSPEYALLASPTFMQNFPYASSHRFKKINEYILKNFNQTITLSQIAEVANMGVTSFCCFFRDQYRLTFVEYLTSVRIGHACKLLAEKDYNIIEIAYECGFNNLANFNRQFRKIKHMTPSDYRRMLFHSSSHGLNGGRSIS